MNPHLSERTMIHKALAFTLLALLPAAAIAQDDIPLLRPDEKEAVNRQSDEFNKALEPVLAEAAKSTVRIWAGRNKLAYGTVIGDGTEVLTKWSEVARRGGSLLIDAGDGVGRHASITGTYPDEDLAVLKLETGDALPAVKWSTETPRLGAFLAAPQPGGRPAAFGVVSVLERNLRETDQSYLGIMGSMDFDGPGVRISEVTPDSGAAEAGLKEGDVILKVGEREISGLLELKNSLVGISPGETVRLLVRSRNIEKPVDVTLGNRPELPKFNSDRLRIMERMGSGQSRVRSSFTHAIQSDMRPEPKQIGGPVVDLKGNVVGITVARADRTRSFIMPAAAVVSLLENGKAMDPSLAEVRNDDAPAQVMNQGRARGQMQRPQRSPRALRQHFEEMQRLMEFMEDELDALDQGR